MSGAVADAAGRGAAGSLADTVLAVVGGKREVTVAGFQSAWSQVEPPARPDSLTPQGAREFLDLLIGKEALGEAAMKETWDWTPKDSADYGGLRDRLIMKVVLDSVLIEARAQASARGEDSLGVEALGILAREKSIQHLAPSYDESLLGRLAPIWAALPKPNESGTVTEALRVLGTNPTIPSEDLPKVVARWKGDEFKVRDLMGYWTSLNPLARPRIEGVEPLRDIVNNGIFERELRRSAKERGIEFWPENADALQKQREYIAVQHFVAREVYAKIPLDSTTLQRYYIEHEDAWILPPIVRLLTLELPDQKQAFQMARRLADSTQVNALVREAGEAGVSYFAEFSAETDSVVFRKAWRLGVGAILGPDSTAKGWVVSRVMEIRGGRPRPYTEVQELVRHAVYGDQGERLMRELLARVRRETTVRTNPAAIERLASR
jgi:hypothetical protein